MISLNKHAISTTIVDRYATTVYSFHFMKICNYRESIAQSQELKFQMTIDPDAFISNFIANIDGEIFNGITKEKDTASKEYKAAKQKNENAILISQPYDDIPNIFQIQTNIDANSTILLQITIEQYLTKQFHCNQLNVQILRSFRKYNIIKKYEYITFEINVKDKSGIFDIEMPSSSQSTSFSNITQMGIIIDSKTDNESNTECILSGRIHYDKSSINELILKYKIKGEQNDSIILFDTETNTFCHIISDIITESMNTSIPRRVVFVIDKSGSMSGSKWNKTVSSTVLALKQLRTSYDRFCLILFDNDIYVWSKQMMETNTRNINKAIQYLQLKSAGGGTNINEPLLKAIQFIKTDIELLNTLNKYFMNQIIFITDGEVHNTTQIIINIKKENDLRNIDKYSSKISIFSFGISSDYNDASWINDVNHSFLKSLSINNNGIYKRIKHSNTDKTLRQYFDILSKPILCNINIKYENKNIINLSKTSFHTLYSGNDLIICGQLDTKQKLSELSITATISAVTGKQMLFLNKPSVTKPIQISKTLIVDIDLDMDYNHNIERIWAYLKLKQFAENKLMYNDMIEIDDDEKKCIDVEPLSLALKHKFITPWTSMIVVKTKEEIKKEYVVEETNVNCRTETNANIPRPQCKRPRRTARTMGRGSGRRERKIPTTTARRRPTVRRGRNPQVGFSETTINGPCNHAASIDEMEIENTLMQLTNSMVKLNEIISDGTACLNNIEQTQYLSVTGSNSGKWLIAKVTVLLAFMLILYYVFFA